MDKDKAKKLLAALQTINTAETSPKMNLIFTCFKDSLARWGSPEPLCPEIARKIPT